jgi:hypothetical protein
MAEAIRRIEFENFRKMDLDNSEIDNKTKG